MSADDEHAEGVDAHDDTFEALLREAFQSGPRALVLPAGTRLAEGRLQIRGRLGQGGMGVVYEAFDRERNSLVALKTLSQLDAGGVYRLKNEFRSLADVRHQNLVRLHELFADGEVWFFTMELVVGEGFDTYVRPADLELDRLQSATAQLVAAVAAIHDAGKLHRDLKPSNVMVTPEGRVVVLDFGLTVDPQLGAAGNTVQDALVSGTPAYMAPEQAAGGIAERASDWYALGVMLFEALTGRLPFEGKSIEILSAKQREEAPSLDAPGVPSELRETTSRLLRRDARSRPDQRTLELAFPPMHFAEVAKSAPIEMLLGRERELALLREAFRSSLAGQPVALFLSGESGIGKSALLETFTAELRQNGAATVLYGRCYERENVPYKGFDALIDELSRHLRKLSREQAALLMPRDVSALARTFPVLNRLSVIAHAPNRTVDDPQEIKRRAQDAFAELLGRMRDRAPLVLAVDDVQWLDRDGALFMRALFAQRELAPVLLLCVHRKEAQPLLEAVREAARISEAVELRTVELMGLSQEAMVALARRSLLADVATPVVEALAGEAQGNPFFVAQIARAARSNAGPVALRDALALHIDALSADERRLLSLLALAGCPLSPSIANRAAALADSTALDRLRAESLVRVSFTADGTRLIECYHDKIREHLVATLPVERARELARALIEAFPAAEPEMLFRLHELAAQYETAVEYASQAADAAFASLAFARAAELYAWSLAHGKQGPDARRRLLARQGESLACIGEGARAADAFLAAADGASADEQSQLRERAGEQLMMCGEVERGFALYDDVLRPMGLRIPRSLAATLTAILWSRLRLAWRGLRYLARAGTAHVEREVSSLGAFAMTLARTDQLRGALFVAVWLRRALDSGHEREIARALGWEIFYLAYLGAKPKRLNALRTLCEQLVASTDDGLARLAFAFGLGNQALLRDHDLARALAAFEVGLANVDSNRRSSVYESAWLNHLRALSLSNMGRLDEAYDIAERESELAQARGDLAIAAPLSFTLAHVLLARDRLEQARRVIAPHGARFSEKLKLSDTMWLIMQPWPALYESDPCKAWYEVALQREIYLSKVQSRVMAPGLVEGNACGVAVAAARASKDPQQRAELTRAAKNLAKRARGCKLLVTGTQTSVALMACLREDRAGAVRALRQCLAEPLTPLFVTCLHYRLGALLHDEEGRAMLADAESTLRSYGVAEPARFVDAMAPGLAI